MTSQGARRPANEGEWSGRLTQGREFHKSQRPAGFWRNTQSYNGAITLMVNAAIAYADAVTAKRKGVVNKQDHQTAPRLLREALGSALPDKHERFFRRLLGRKDEVNYGARGTTHAEAGRLLAELDEFAAWIEGAL